MLMIKLLQEQGLKTQHARNQQMLYNQANSLILPLTNGIDFEDRTEDFKYTNVLYEKDYVQRLQRWLNYFDEYYFEFLDDLHHLYFYFLIVLRELCILFRLLFYLFFLSPKKKKI